DGETATQNLGIKIVDDAPTAANDANSITEDVASVAGNVATNDTVGADGADVTAIISANAPGNTATNTAGVLEIVGEFGTLTINPDGSYIYELDNDNSDVNALKTGVSLTESFTYTLEDGDGDKATARLDITIDGNTDGTPSIAANDTTAGVDGHITVRESGLTDGTDASSDSEAANGTITITALDGLQSITVGGENFTLEQLEALASTPSASYTINVDGGTLVLTGFTATETVGGVPTKGELNYTYTLTGEQTHSGAEDAALTLDIPLSVTDAGNATTNGTLTVRVEDDAPQAVADTGNVSEGATLTVTATDGVLSNDTAGADGWANSGNAVVGVAAGTTPAAENANVGQAIAGTYGTLTLNADGSYTYVSTANAVTSDAKDVFTYTVKDSDGDLVETTLTINVADVTGTPVNTNGSVDEAGLANGTEAATDSESISGGSLNLQPGWTVTEAQSGSNALGSWTVNTDGTFDYTLTSATADVAGQDETDTFSYTARDQYGNTVTNTVTIIIADDAPLVALSGTSPGSVTVDESNFAAGSVSATDADFVNGVFDIDHGADGAANTDGTVYSLNVANGTASGVTDTATSSDIYLFMDGTDVVGRVGNNASGTEAFRIAIDPTTGAATLTQSRALKHPNQSDHDDLLGLTDGAVQLVATATDGDGDTASQSVNVGGKFSFKDDGPSIITAPADGQVDEAYLERGSQGEDPSKTQVANSLNVDFGTDGAGNVEFTQGASDSTTAGLTALGLQSDGEDVLYLVSGDGHTLTAYTQSDGANDPVFTVQITDATGAPGYLFTLSKPVDHLNRFGDSVSGLDLQFEHVRVTDGDGDLSNTDFTITVMDDAPDPNQAQLVTVVEDSSDNTFNTNADATGNNTVIGDGSNGTVAPAHGTATVNPDGTITYVPDGNYSGEDTFTYTTSTDDGEKTYTVTVNVTPVADAPTLTVDAAEIGTQEDTAVALGLNAPVVVDDTDQNGAASGDNPERLGEITLSGLPEGAVLSYGSSSYTVDASGSVTIVLSDGQHISGVSADLSMSEADFEAMTVTPPLHAHNNFTVNMAVTSFEVDAAGNKLSGVAGATSNASVAVKVQAVTDDAALVFDTSKTSGVTNVDAVSYGGTGGNTEAAVTLKEDSGFNLKDILSAQFKDLDGSEVRSITLENTTGQTILVNGRQVASGNSVTINDKAGANGQTGDISSFPNITVGGVGDFSGDLNGIKVTINAQDKDRDGYLNKAGPANGVAEEGTTNNSVDLNLKVTPVAGDVVAGDVTTEEDTAVNFLENVRVTDTGTGSEVIDSVAFEIPAGWTVAEPTNSGGWSVSGAGTSADPYTITFADSGTVLTEEQREAVLDGFTITPPPHSSADAAINLKVTTKDTNGTSDTKVTDLPVKVTVTPVAERTDTDSDGAAGNDVTINDDKTYTTHGKEDDWFALNSDGFDMKADWANEDASEQTFARLTPYDGNDVALEGAYFQYHNGTTTVDVAYNGTPVDIPMEYLDTVRFKGPNNFKGEVKIKVEAVTLDKDADDNSVTVEAVSGEAWLTNVILDPVADQVTLKVNARITANEDAGRDGTDPVQLSINPTSGDDSEAFNVTIKGIPAGASITYKGVTYSVGNGLVDDGNGGYQLELSNFDKAQQPTLTPPKDSNETINLTVSAVSVDTLGDTTSTSAAHELPVTITLTGVPDTPNMVVAESPSYVEQTLDNADNTVALHELITSLSSGETSNDGSETLTLRISGLPEGFALLGAGAVVGAGTGSARVWVVKPDQIADGTVKIQLPANYSGTVNFTAQPVVTENDNPSETFFDAQNVEFQVTPSPEASLKVASSIAEDQVGRIDLSPVYQNGDNDEVISVVRIQAVEGLALFSDAAGTKPLTAVDGWYEITGVDAVKSIYAKASANFSGDIPLTVKYKVTDTAQDNTTGPVETADFKDGSHTLQVQPVTDAVLAEVASINGSNVNDQTAISHTATQPGDVTLSLNISKQPDNNANDERDYDGSEAITHILIQNVPEGVAVKGGIYTGDGQWLLPVTTAFNGDITQDVVFSVGRQAGGLTNSAITITVATQDGTASPAKDSISWQLTTDFTKGGNEQTLPTVSLSEIEAAQTEDTGFALNSVVSASVDTTGASQSSYSMTLTLRTAPDDETSFSGAGMLRTEVVENGQTVVLWTMTVPVNDGDNPQTIAENLLAGVTVTSPADANSNANNLNGKLPLDVTLTLHDSGLESEAQVTPQVTLDPVTDPATVAISAAAVAEGEPVAISVTVSNPSDQTGDWSIVDGKLYLRLDGTDIPGVLKQGDAELKLENVSNVSGLDDGQYYVIGGVSPDTPLDLTYVPNNAYDSGTITLKGWVQNQEAGSVVELASGSGGLTVNATNTRPDITLSAAGTEHDGEIRTQAEIQVNGTVLPDEDETLQAAFIEGLPKEFTLYYGSDANSAGLANNAGGGTWQIPLSNGELPAYLAIQPPAYWSGTLSGLKLYLVGGETGNTPTSWPFDFEVVIAPRADGVELSPTLSFGDAGDIIDLNLNAAMKDPVATNTEDPADSDQHTELTTLELEGLPDGARVVFYVNDTELAADRVSFDSNTNTHTITGLTQDELDGLGVLHLGTEGAIDINVKAWTQETTVANGTLVGDKSGETTGIIKVNVADKLPTTGNDNLLWTGSPIDARGGEDTIQLRYGENLIGSDLATNLDNIETLDLSIAGSNAIGSDSDRLRAEDVLEMTDDDNVLKILGDENDSVHLDSEWGDPSTPDTDGFVSYTAEVNNVEVTLKIDESVTIIE
ncbi:DUF5801 repeats-in-toxin domain-containing protein, partial [Halomonas marinisediminis]